MSSALDAIGRVVLLVLSGIATLALIGAIAQVSDIDPGGLPPGEVAQIEPASPAPPPAADPSGVTVAPNAPAALGTAPTAATGRIDAEAVRWLKALAYAVMALAGFAAAALVVLLRITATLARIAER